MCLLQQAMRPPSYANAYPNGMPGQQQRPHMAMTQGIMPQGNMGMPQGPMSPVMSGVGNMQPPQVLMQLVITCMSRQHGLCIVAWPQLGLNIAQQA